MTRTLERFLVRPREQEAEVATQFIAQAGMDMPKKKRARKGSAWSQWTEDQKQQCCILLAKHGYKHVRNQHGSQTPPASTMRTWMQTMCLQGKLRLPGRPKWLTAGEEDQLYQAILSMRRHGCIVDRETILVMATATMKLSRGQDSALPEMSIHWARHFRSVMLVFFMSFLHAVSTGRDSGSGDYDKQQQIDHP